MTDVQPSAWSAWPLLVVAEVGGAVVTLVRAMVIAHLWQWFAADVFGWPRVGVIPVAGLLLILGFAAAYFTKIDRTEPVPSAGQLVGRCLGSILSAASVMVLGLLFVQFR